MISGKDAFDIAIRLGDYVGTTYRVHLTVISTILGGLSTAYISHIPVGWEIRIVLLILYLFVAVTSLVFLHDTYVRINAALNIAQQRFLDELEHSESDYGNAEFERLTRVVRGHVLRKLFPAIIVIFAVLILFFPSAG
ncbi:MAG: hypothetical protein ACTSVG_03415 [Alphaproteobacteria bacterium]